MWRFKKWLAITLFLALPILANASTRYVGEAYNLIYTIQDENGDHVSGEAPTLLIRRNSDGYVYDWNDSTFKNSGWTNKTTALTEDSTDGFYHKQWTPPGSEVGSETYAFLVDNADTNGYGDHQAEVVSYVNVANAVWDEALSNHQSAGTAGKKLDDVPTSGVGDWTTAEKDNIKSALSVDDGTKDTNEDLESIWKRLKSIRR